VGSDAGSSWDSDEEVSLSSDEESLEASNPIEHVREAISRRWKFYEGQSLDEDVLGNIRALARDSKGVDHRRWAALQYWRRRAVALEEERKLFFSKLPSWKRATVGKIHMPLLAEMLEEAGHTDMHLIRDLVVGFKVVGELDAGEQGVSVEGGRLCHGKPAHFEVPCLEELRASCSEINRLTLAQATPCEHAEAVWKKTKEEVDKGLIINMRSIEEADLNKVLLVRRFGISQQGVKGVKVRPIDDFRHNFANSFSVAWSTSRNDREDTLTAAIAELQRELSSCGSEEDVLIGLEDFVAAFKTLCPAEDQDWLLQVLVYNTDAQTWQVGEIVSMPFGSMGSVLAWFRVASALKVITRRLFELVTLWYVDDVQQVETTSSARTGKYVFQSVMKLLGWELDGAKSQAMARKATALGCEVAVLKQSIVWSLTQEKAERWYAELEACLEADEMPSEEAGRFAGRLQFGAERVFARAGRAAIRPLYWRQHSSTAVAMTRRLRWCVMWWMEYLASLPSRQIRWSSMQNQAADFLVYTDAEHKGKIGVVVFDIRCGRTYFVQSSVPCKTRRKLRRRKTQIVLFELLAVGCAVTTFGNMLRGSKVVFFVDNQSSLNMLIRGYSKATDANEATFGILMNVAKLGIEAHWQYVISKCNIADGPSRGRLEEMAIVGAVEAEASWEETCR